MDSMVCMSSGTFNGEKSVLSLLHVPVRHSVHNGRNPQTLYTYVVVCDRFSGFSTSLYSNSREFESLSLRDFSVKFDN